jgi:putative salt-induced outer membrane protein YdiY
MTLVSRRLRLLVASVVLSSIALPSFADEAPPKKWKDTAEGSFVNTNGNSKATTTSAKDLFTYHFDAATKLEIEGGALGARSQGQVTTEQYYAGEKAEQKVDDRNYLYERLRWDKNRFAGVANRYDFSLGGGRDIWKTKTDLWSAEGGPGYVNEERTHDKRRSYASARAYTRYAHDFSPTAKFSQDAEWLQSLADKRDNRISTETDLVTTLTTRFSVKTSFVWKHVSQPPPNTIKDDTVTAVALIANF